MSDTNIDKQDLQAEFNDKEINWLANNVFEFGQPEMLDDFSLREMKEQGLAPWLE